MAIYTVTTSNEIRIYTGRNERKARKAARDDRGPIDRPVVIRKDGERFAAYTPRKGKRGFWSR